MSDQIKHPRKGYVHKLTRTAQPRIFLVGRECLSFLFNPPGAPLASTRGTRATQWDLPGRACAVGADERGNSPDMLSTES